MPKVPLAKQTMLKFLLIFSLSFLISSEFLSAQGCSDAGICSLSSTNPNRSTSNFNLGIDLSTESGGELVKYNYFNLLPSYKSGDFTFFVKLPIVYLSGLTGDPNGNNTALYSFSDITLGGKYNIINETDNLLNFSLAAKLPTNRGDVKDKGMILPMTLQTNQGSYDLLASFDYLYKNTRFFFGTQIPLTSNQNSTFDGVMLTELKRSPDIALGVKQRISINEKSTFKLGLLSLYRLSENVWKANGTTDVANVNYRLEDGNYVAINSNGLTLNLLVGFEQKLNENNSIALNLGVPMVNRKYIDDGLKRAYTVSLTTNIGF